MQNLQSASGKSGLLGVAEILFFMQDYLVLIVVEEPCDSQLRILAQIEIVCIGEEITLELIVAVILIRDILKELEVLVELIAVAQVEELLDIADDARLMQSVGYLDHVHTLGDLDFSRSHCKRL